MPKMATKAAKNVFYKARIAAASWNDKLSSREGAAEVTGIDRTRLANIELHDLGARKEKAHRCPAYHRPADTQDGM